MENEKTMKLIKYSIEPYYGQVRVDKDDGIPYILKVPTPLSKEQMEILIKLIKEFKFPSTGFGDGLELTEWKDTRYNF